MRNSYILLSDTTGSINKTGNPMPGCGINPNITNGKNTIAVTTGPKFVGRIYIEGSLVLEPTENDWFNISVSDEENNRFEFIEFPLFKTLKNGIKIVVSDHKTYRYFFEGVPVRVRARLDRTYLPDYKTIEKEQFVNMRWKVDLGNIQQVVMNYN